MGPACQPNKPLFGIPSNSLSAVHTPADKGWRRESQPGEEGQGRQGPWRRDAAAVLKDGIRGGALVAGRPLPRPRADERRHLPRCGNDDGRLCLDADLAWLARAQGSRCPLAVLNSFPKPQSSSPLQWPRCRRPPPRPDSPSRSSSVAAAWPMAATLQAVPCDPAATPRTRRGAPVPKPSPASSLGPQSTPAPAATTLLYPAAGG